MGGRGTGPLGPVRHLEVLVENNDVLGQLATNFEYARAAADAGAAEYLALEAENESLRHLLTLAVAGWALTLGGNQ